MNASLTVEQRVMSIVSKYGSVRTNEAYGSLYRDLNALVQSVRDESINAHPLAVLPAVNNRQLQNTKG